MHTSHFRITHNWLVYQVSEDVGEQHIHDSIDSDTEEACLVELENFFPGALPLTLFWQRACLRVKNYNAERAAAIMQAYADWRLSFEVNSRPVHEDERLLYLVHHGVVEAPCFIDRCGHHTLIIRMNRADPTRWSPQDAVRCVHAAIEYAFLRFPMAQRRGIAVMIDMRNISASNMDIRVPRALLSAFSNHLPLRFGAVYLINPPIFMRFALNLVKVFLKRKLQRRVHIVKGDCCVDDGILKYFVRETLPTDMGGPGTYDHAAYCALVEAIHSHYPNPERFLEASSFDRHPNPYTIDEIITI